MAIVKNISGGAQLSDADQLRALTKEVADIQAAKIGAEKELELCRRQYNETVAKVQAAGVQNVEDLPARIAELRQDLQERLAAAWSSVTSIKTRLSSMPS